eukprot:CAMPEP_0184716484 /NCGR_PEP_ID=MMETSP0314-20130426/6225_1 /TAXON_ID=38298 /ORGANISM="Rhodella maculata, Strain CCMP 736" /LENGTH=55 /DNA_ID=CAMNT_0027179901 /DNA_START=346 /DNA_END=513 /DNA_ORIENTATION=-
MFRAINDDDTRRAVEAASVVVEGGADTKVGNATRGVVIAASVEENMAPARPVAGE